MEFRVAVQHTPYTGTGHAAISDDVDETLNFQLSTALRWVERGDSEFLFSTSRLMCFKLKFFNSFLNASLFCYKLDDWKWKIVFMIWPTCCRVSFNVKFISFLSAHTFWSTKRPGTLPVGSPVTCQRYQHNNDEVWMNGARVVRDEMDFSSLLYFTLFEPERLEARHYVNKK